MRARRLIAAAAALVAAAVLWLAWSGYVETGRWRFLLTPWLSTPHEAYAESLREAGLATTALGTAWFSTAQRAVSDAADVALPYREAVWLPADQPRALAVKAQLRRGQRLVVRGDVESPTPIRVFVDVFEQRGGELRHVANAARDTTTVEFEVRRDATYVVRLQPELLREARVTLTWNAQPTLRLPVEGASRSSIGSYFLASRDSGRRQHHGVDIFAARRTRVTAAADGIVAAVGENPLGGRVVWVVRPRQGERHYYAHLDEQLVSAGTPVAAGDVLGLVGTTGNARGGPPHLHFGIYAGGGPVDPLPYLEPPVEPPRIAAAGRLGELARLRTGSTPVRVVGAAADSLRVVLPDGRERFVTVSAIETTSRPLRTMRIEAPATLWSNAVDGVAMDTLLPPARVSVLGSFAGASYVRHPDGRTGWWRPI